MIGAAGAFTCAAIIVVGLLASATASAAQDGIDPPQQQTRPPMVQDPGLNRQILETLKDIRDSQLSVLQAQVEILSILRSQGRTPASHSHAADPQPAHRPATARAEANSAQAALRTIGSAAR
jgi:hypothetical protein